MNIRLGIWGIVATVTFVMLPNLADAQILRRRVQNPSHAPVQQQTQPAQEIDQHLHAQVDSPPKAEPEPSSKPEPQPKVESPEKAATDTQPHPVTRPTPTPHPPAQFQAQVKVDPQLPNYQPVEAFRLKIVGSDTMKNELTLLIEGFTKIYPSVGSEIESKGSSSGPPALVAGTAQFVGMSRAMKAKEVNDFKKKFGYLPVGLPTSIDMLAVFVHKDNPIAGLTLQQVDAIFSRERRGGHEKEIKTWGDLGLEGEWAEKPITIYGRNAASGTQQFFREHALFNGTFRAEVKEQDDSTAVVDHVAHDKYAIGYSGIGFKTADVRALPLAADYKSPYFSAEPKHAYSGEYALTRVLLHYVNHQPGTQLDSLRREFIRYLYSQQGQADVIRSGFLPVGNIIAERALASVELEKTSIEERPR